MDTFQIILYASLFVMAAINVITLVWAFRLDAKVNKKPATKNYDVHVEGTKFFSEQEMAEVGKQAENDLREVMHRSAEQLEGSLSATIAGLNEKTQDMVSMTLSQEFEKYNASLEALREQTVQEFNNIQVELDKRRDRLYGELESAVMKDREGRMDAFNARLNDVVASYLVETLDKGVDLGAQSAYILHTLENHKDEIKKDVLS